MTAVGSLLPASVYFAKGHQFISVNPSFVRVRLAYAAYVAYA